MPWSTGIRITSVNHGLRTGQRVNITGALGNTAANGTWTVTVIDPNLEWRVTPDKFHSKSRNTPFTGMSFTPVGTLTRTT